MMPFLDVEVPGPEDGERFVMIAARFHHVHDAAGTHDVGPRGGEIGAARAAEIPFEFGLCAA
jgi:hypothetical protein